jgi:hypothetical protein
VDNYIDSCKKLLEETRGEAENSPDPEIEKVASEIGSANTVDAYALAEPLHGMMEKYKTKAESQLTPLSDDIRALGDNLRDTLQEILLRRDYIIYTCRLCPGQVRQLR